MASQASRASTPLSLLPDVQLKPLPMRLSAPSVGEVAGVDERDLVSRVRGEFKEMGGFSPTVEQAARLFQVDRDECTRILGRLVDEGFLRLTPDGRYRLPA